MNTYNLTGQDLENRVKSDINKQRKTVCVDFDGVIHPYTNGWQGIDPTIEAPVKGIREELDRLKDNGFIIAVLTTRAQSRIGIDAVKHYLDTWRVPYDKITATKIGAICYIDDRAVLFDGDATGLADKVISFKSWTESKGIKKISISLTENQWDILRNLVEQERNYRGQATEHNSEFKTPVDGDLDTIYHLIDCALRRIPPYIKKA